MADGSDAGWVRELAGLAVRDVDGPVALVEVLQPGAEQVLLADALGRGPVHEMARLTPSLSDVFRETAR
jgi:ABC-2 type transport system ATP-binding protein